MFVLFIYENVNMKNMYKYLFVTDKVLCYCRQIFLVQIKNKCKELKNNLSKLNMTV